jgi:hypothetical protein
MWYLTLRQVHRLKIFENRVLRNISLPKRDEMVGGLRKLHNEQLDNMYFSSNILRMMRSRKRRWAGYVAHMGRRGMHTGFCGKARRKETTRKI